LAYSHIHVLALNSSTCFLLERIKLNFIAFSEILRNCVYISLRIFVFNLLNYSMVQVIL
jgi:hypothetical protein